MYYWAICAVTKLGSATLRLSKITITYAREKGVRFFSVENFNAMLALACVMY